jgi:hypothetical protein
MVLTTADSLDFENWRNLDPSPSACMTASMRSETCAKTVYLQMFKFFLAVLESGIRHQTPRVPGTSSHSTDCMVSLYEK